MPVGFIISEPEGGHEYTFFGDSPVEALEMYRVMQLEQQALEDYKVKG